MTVEILRDLSIIVFSITGVIGSILVVVIIFKTYKKFNRLVDKTEGTVNKIESIAGNVKATVQKFDTTLESVRTSFSTGVVISEIFRRLGRLIK